MNGNIIWHLSFSVRLTSLSIISSKSIHVAANGIILFFFVANSLLLRLLFYSFTKYYWPQLYASHSLNARFWRAVTMPSEFIFSDPFSSCLLLLDFRFSFRLFLHGKEADFLCPWFTPFSLEAPRKGNFWGKYLEWLCLCHMPNHGRWCFHWWDDDHINTFILRSR